MALFQISKSSLPMGKGTFTVTPAPKEAFSGRKAQGHVTVTNGSASKVVTCVKDYPLYENITKVMNGSTAVSNYQNIPIASTGGQVAITMVSNKATWEISNVTGLIFSIKIGDQWLNHDGTLSNTQSNLSDEEYSVVMPNNLGLTTAYTVVMTFQIPANSFSYEKVVGVDIEGNGFTFKMASGTATLTATPTSLTWDETETAAKTVTVTHNGSSATITSVDVNS